MLDVRNYLEEIKHIIKANSPAQLKMFVLRHVNEHPGLQPILQLNRVEMKIFLHYLKERVLPKIEEELNEMTNDPH